MSLAKKQEQAKSGLFAIIPNFSWEFRTTHSGKPGGAYPELANKANETQVIKDLLHALYNNIETVPQRHIRYFVECSVANKGQMVSKSRTGYQENIRSAERYWHLNTEATSGGSKQGQAWACGGFRFAV